MVNKWILVRHPDKEGDAEGVYAGNKARVTEKGMAQIERMAARLRLMHPDLILSSELPRAIELARVLAQHNSMRIASVPSCKLFNEIDKPQFLVGMERNDPRHDHLMWAIRDGFDMDRTPDLAFVQKLWEGFDDHPVPQSFSVKTRSELEEETRQTFALIERYFTKFNTILTVSHAKRIASYVHWTYRNGTLEGYYREADENLMLENAGVTILVHKPSRRTRMPRWHIGSVNDVSHEDIAYEFNLKKLLAKVT